MNAYVELTNHYKKIADLRHVYSIAAWDEAAMMPAGGGDARGQALATLDVVIHEMVANNQVGGWLAACDRLELDAWQTANVREIRREFEEMTVLPSAFVHKRSVAASRCEQAWRVHRENNDWNSLRSLLEEVVVYAREEANIRSDATGLGKYDAMLDTYEPGTRSARLDELFAGLKDFLPSFIDEVLEKQGKEQVLPVGDDFPVENQRQLGLEVMKTLGFDFDRGRLDVSHHPFCGGVQQDVRITTRYTNNNFDSSLMAVIHETGHAMYEQGRPADWQGQPVGQALSAGTHESQSLLMEMQACRSKEFLTYLAPVVRRHFGVQDDDPAWSVDNLYRLNTRVKRDFIRVDADEVTYPLHVILRYEIEKALIEGEIEVADLPEIWNGKMLSFLKLDTTGNFTDGVLQDVHWPAGLFGYFPTYTLGAMMAAQFFAGARNGVHGLMDQISEGEFNELLAWLRENVHHKGSYLNQDELLESATGEPLNADYFIKHLTARYG